MDLRRCAHVVALADEGHFRRAAERVHLSQPALSRSIQAAEAELGLVLFERGERGSEGVRCTPAGEFIVDRLRSLLRRSQALERDLRQLREGAAGQLAIGAGPFIAAQLLPGLLEQLRRRHPRLQVQVMVRHPQVMLEPARRGELDFFIGDGRFAAGDALLDVQPIGRVRGGLYVRGGHPLLALEDPQMADIAVWGLATGRLPPEVHQRMLDRMKLPPGDPSPVAVDCDDLQVLKAITRSTDCVLVATPGMVQEEVAAGALVELVLRDAPEQHAELALVFRRGKPLSPAAAYAADLAREALARGIGPA